jgi:N-acetyl sugar amidotransferase
MYKITWCKNCILPNTRPNIFINHNGICNACENHNAKELVNWSSKLTILKEITNKIKKKSKFGFDCLIPVSGGKDSTWQTYNCLKLGLKPLAFTWKNPGMTFVGQKNLDNLIKIGVDHIQWTVNPAIEAKFMLKTFKKLGSAAIPMHFAIHNIATRIANKFGIPLIVWGENSAVEYGQVSRADLDSVMSNSWRKYYGVNNGTVIYDWVGNDLKKKDLLSYMPSSSKNKKFTEIFLGNFIKWDPIKVYKFSKKIGFKQNNKSRTGIYKFADIDDDFISIHHWMKWYKFGITRDFDNLSLEIRNGRISRDKAIDILKSKKNFLPLDDIKKFCKYTNININNFFAIAEKFRNRNIWTKINNKWRIDNFLINGWKW